MELYIHHTSCISPQKSFESISIKIPEVYTNGKMLAIEPSYEGIPVNVLRRMGKAVRLSVGAAIPLLKKTSLPDGIIIGTANGGMDDCIKFLNQIIEYEEGVLTPANFVQSTANAIAGQIGLISANRGYNITHVHMGHAFENALIDAAMQLSEKKGSYFLAGAVDDISSYNYNINFLEGLFKQTAIPNTQLYDEDSEGSLAGEGAALFIVSNNSENAIAKIVGIKTANTKEVSIINTITEKFIQQHLPAGEKIDLLLTGENGDNRLLKYYNTVEAALVESTTIARFKHLCGEYPTSSAFALWLATGIMQSQNIELHCLKKQPVSCPIKRILLYNNYKGEQHSWIMLESKNLIQ